MEESSGSSSVARFLFDAETRYATIELVLLTLIGTEDACPSN